MIDDRLRWACRSLVVVSLAAGIPVHADDIRAARELAGTWKFLAVESEEKGWDASWEKVATWAWWIRDEDISGPGPLPGVTEASFELNPQTTPKEIDLTYHDGSANDRKLHGIYKLDRGRLTICVRSKADSGDGRPSTFTFEGGRGQSLLILEKFGNSPPNRSK